MELFFEYLKYLLGPVVALIGILITYPLLRKKLLENHVTQKLNEIQKANSKIYSSNLHIIEHYIQLLDSSSNKITHGEVKKIASKIKKVYYSSAKASSDVHTLLFYLNIVLQKILNNIDKEQHKSIDLRSYINFTIRILHKVNFYSTMVVPVPGSYKLEKKKLIKKPIHKYVTHGEVFKYKHFNLGLISDVNSAQFLIFTDIVNRSNIPLLIRATFQIYRRPNAILKLLYNDRIYAPYKLKIPSTSLFTEESFLDLFLIGYNFKRTIFVENKESVEVVELIYSNLDDIPNIGSPFDFEKHKEYFLDPVIKNSCFDIYNSSYTQKCGFQYFKIAFKKEYLHELFRNNNWQMKDLLNK